MQPGWQDERRTNFESLMTGVPVKEDLGVMLTGPSDCCLAIREKAPLNGGSRLVTRRPFSKEFYQKGIKQYLTDKVNAHMDLTRQMELADFAKGKRSDRAQIDC